MPAEAVAAAGFDWFETGYPGDTRTNEILASAGVRPFAYINLGELHDDLRGASGYSGPILRTNGDWGTYLVDVTHPSWQDWLVRRADEAYRSGSRGVKWDVATPDVPPGRTRADVNDAMASVMQRILEQHPDLEVRVQPGVRLRARVSAVRPRRARPRGSSPRRATPARSSSRGRIPGTGGRSSSRRSSSSERGVPIFIAEYADPFSDRARELYGAITAQGFVPYITSEYWNVRGWGYNVNPGW